MKFKQILITAFLVSIILSSCGDSEHPVYYDKDTHSRGHAKLYIDDSYQRLFDTGIGTFESLYAKADIEPIYCNESEALLAFFKDSTKTVCLNRDFTKAEKEALKKVNIEIRSTKIAEDAIAFIVHPDNTDTLFTVDRLKRALTEQNSYWLSINSLEKNAINIVFDNKASGNARYLRELCKNKPLQKNVFAVNSNKEVIDYVAKNKHALGVIGVNWISDNDDLEVLGFLNQLKVVAVAKDATSEYFKPYQAYIKTKDYPFIRDVWMINKGRKSGLNTGFVLFMSGEKGQLLVLKSGLVPAVSPVRLVEVNTQPTEEYMK